MKNTVILLSVFLFLSAIVSAVDPDPSEYLSIPNQSGIDSTDEYSGNLFYLTGTIGWFIGGTINYEGLIFHEPDVFVHDIFLRLGAGYVMNIWYEHGPLFLASLTTRLGSWKRDVELGLGISCFLDWYDYKMDRDYQRSTGRPVPLLSTYSLLTPQVSIGLRRIILKDRLILRTGIGWPEMTYFSTIINF